MSTNWSVWFRNVSLCRAGNQILDNIDIELRVGDFTLLTGQNGSGKSTLLRIISGLLKPDLAVVEHHNSNSSWRLSRQFLRQNICYLHQQPYLFHGTVFDNMAYGLKRKGINRKTIDLTVNQALEYMSLTHLTYRNSRELSGGEKQRVAIARSWIIRPKIILLDEPFANMDKRSRQQCYQLINSLHQDNIGVFITSHDPQQGELNINHHIHLYNGSMEIKN